jgi:hypothetical protein
MRKKLTPEEIEERRLLAINAAVATAIGWEIPDHCSHKNQSRGAPPPFGRPQNGVWQDIPNFIGSLDALRPALETLSNDEFDKFLDHLFTCVGIRLLSEDGDPWVGSDFKSAFLATPEQLCRAFLAAKGVRLEGE